MSKSIILKEEHYNDIICCPVCGQSLKKRENAYICDNRHSFDVAKEGYVNLLSPNQKKSKNPGDNKEMIFARRDFLNSDAYKPLLNKIISIIEEYKEANIIVEAGCGEGYYISNIKNALCKSACYGFDISKDAIKLACKRSKNVHFYVSSSYSTNIKDKSVDILLVIFAPFPEDEISRILKDDGICIVVKPADNHLVEIKQELYQTIKPAPTDKYRILNLVKTERLTYRFEVKEHNLLNLFKMTPFFYRTSDIKRQNLLKNCSQGHISADFFIQHVKK